MPDSTDHGSTDAASVDSRLATEYARARERMTAIAGELGDDQAVVIVPACPDWTVADLFAHVSGLATELGQGRPPTGDTDAWVAAMVTERRGRSLAELTQEWSASGPAFESLIADKPYRWWGLVYDVLVHEHDLRGAVGWQEQRDDAALGVALDLGLRLVADDLAKHQLPAVRIVTASNSNGDDATERIVGEGDVALSLQATPFETLRLLGSRRTIEEMRAAAFTGDLDRFLPGLVHMGLPPTSLGES